VGGWVGEGEGDRQTERERERKRNVMHTYHAICLSY